MKINWKKAIGLTAAAAMLLPLAACGSDTASNGGSSSTTTGTTEVTLSVWSPQEDQAKGKDGSDSWLAQVEKKFEEAHPDYKITWKNDVVSEADASKTVIADPAAAADVYMFANDQLGALVKAGAIGELGENEAKQVKDQNSQVLVDSVTGTDGKLYGVPYTANTWFMYYDSSVFSADDVKSWDTMLSKAAVSFPMTNGWNMASWFTKSADLTFFGDNSNPTDASKGISVDVDKLTATTKYLVKMANNPNFINDDDTSGMDNLKAGKVHAYFSGTWNASAVKDILAPDKDEDGKADFDHYAAAQLPKFTVDGQEYQMYSFAGSKAAAYNPNAKNSKVAAQFAAFLGSSDAQKLHWDLRGVVPSDNSLADYEGNGSDFGSIAKDPAAQAQIATIANTSILQPSIAAMGEWWDPAKAYGASIVNKETTEDNAAQKAADFAKLLAAMTKTE
ncbi:ABC transporter substrate-binding protein [Bifidobacterium sp. 82T10]|uniref:ABC transporter substrate-binding protein n=1 Tax=Bifidobacterium miconis TaxID=2834435 RepID=A0ABS6WFM9_9BIFI|nr:extracellular solute-binding protein [Bifidobacterium miconis]MBW3092092.1 ABC transporter substrate-binding protein [Bifidobacterium miconis]